MSATDDFSSEVKIRQCASSYGLFILWIAEHYVYLTSLLIMPGKRKVKLQWGLHQRTVLSLKCFDLLGVFLYPWKMFLDFSSVNLGSCPSIGSFLSIKNKKKECMKLFKCNTLLFYLILLQKVFQFIYLYI